MTYRKIGGLRFVRIGRFGFSFWVSRRKARIMRRHPALTRLMQLCIED